MFDNKTTQDKNKAKQYTKLNSYAVCKNYNGK